MFLTNILLYYSLRTDILNKSVNNNNKINIFIVFKLKTGKSKASALLSYPFQLERLKHWNENLINFLLYELLI